MTKISKKIKLNLEKEKNETKKVNYNTWDTILYRKDWEDGKV